MRSLRLFSFLLSFSIFFSCSQSLDFNQIENYTLKPSISAALAFFKIDAANFRTPSGEPIVTEISKTVGFKLFESSFIQENTVKLDLEFEVGNEFNRNITIEISLLDANDHLVYKFNDLKISENNLNFKQKELIDIGTNQNVRNFTKVLFLAAPSFFEKDLFHRNKIFYDFWKF